MKRKVNRDPNHEVVSFSFDHSDGYFAELCALAPTGSLSAEEWRQLEVHLSHCASCRDLKAQYDKVVATTLPAMAGNRTQPADGQSSDSWSIDRAEAMLRERIERENITHEEAPQPLAAPASKWHLPWPYAGAAIFLVISVIGAYRLSVSRGVRSSSTERAQAPPPHEQPPHNGSPQASATLSTAKEQEAAAKETELRRQLEASKSGIAALMAQRTALESQLEERNADLEQETQARAELERQLRLAQSNAQILQDKLTLAANQAPRETGQPNPLQSQVDQLTAALREKDRQIAQREELLQHDRDIRDLMGARDLYIGEIYDVAKTGKTQKPYGRVFYTKGESLVFYAYDLDQQPGVKLASTFQAWGRRGIDQRRDISLGVFFQDDENKKRWVLKSSDSATLAQLDAVFVTVEPHGESPKPTGKPLLFTYLRLTPNHP